jgi:antitoxin VbhA-like protein
MTNKGKIDEQERALRAEAVEYGFATVRLEGLEPGPEAEALAQRFVNGELSEEEYELAIKELALSIIRNGH